MTRYDDTADTGSNEELRREIARLHDAVVEGLRGIGGLLFIIMFISMFQAFMLFLLAAKLGAVQVGTT